MSWFIAPFCSLVVTAFLILTTGGCVTEGAPPPTAPDVADVELACPDVAEPGEDGEPAPHSSHHGVLTFQRDLVGAQVDVRVDEMPDDGLRFFALQVSFEDAWAHGGLQGDMEANWGGLKSDLDYGYRGHEAEVLEVLQNGPARLAPVTWELGRWYRYEIARGSLETLPAGPYAVLDDDPVDVDHDREMWRWDFTITDVETDVVIYEAALHTRAATFGAISYWTETGYGVTCNDRLTVHWTDPLVSSASEGGPHLPQRVKKSLGQSTCPLACTTDVAQADHGGAWGTTQTYGRAREEASTSGQVLWLRAR
jgi:hypothetical protein